jgi:tetratricopeptide (TPR) repeat protein
MEERWLSYKSQAERAVQQNKLEHAEALWYAALQESEEFAEHDPRITITLECLAEVLFKQHKYGQAEPLCHRTLQIYEETIGPEHPDVGILANNLAMLYHMQDKFEQAESLYKKALNVLTKSLGAKHPEVINLLGNYANMLFRTHRDAEAEQFKAMARGATSGKWNMSGRYQAFNAGGVAPAAPQPAAPLKPPDTRNTYQQQAETIPPSQGKPTASLQSSQAPAQAPPPVQMPVMPESPQIPLPPSSEEPQPQQSGIGRLMQQRKESLK